jgi:hypothetical protein
MGFVMNVTKEPVHTQMRGSWFKFAPGQKKHMDQHMCSFIQEHRGDTGLVVLPSEFETRDYEDGPASWNAAFADSAEGKEILSKKTEEGITNLLRHHKNIIRNNQFSLRQELARKYPHGDSANLALLEMSDGEKESLQVIARYQKNKMDSDETKVREIKKLLEQAGPALD